MELMVVLAIIGLTLGVAGPAFLVRASEVDDATGAIAATLNAARSMALERNVQTTVHLDVRRRRVWVESDAFPTRFDTSFLVELPAGTSAGGTDGRLRFTFRADGSALGDTLAMVIGQTTEVLTIDAATGRVQRSRSSIGQVAR